MRHPDDDSTQAAEQSTDWGVAIAIAMAIVICLAAFVLIFVGLEPFMSDFTGSEVVLTPDPSVVPIEGTAIASPALSP